MSAKIIYFPTDRVFSTNQPLYPFPQFVETVSIEDTLPEHHQENTRFEEILLNEELSGEMFPPEYFMMVE